MTAIRQRVDDLWYNYTPNGNAMHILHHLTTIAYLLYLISSVHAAPSTPNSHASPLSPPPWLPLSLQHSNPPSRPRSRRRIHPRFTDPIGVKTVTFNSLTHKTIFTYCASVIPMHIAARSVANIYFEIFFNLSPHGAWYNIPPMSRVLIQSRDVYLVFTAASPDVPVPWALVRDWAQAMEHMTDMGWVLGQYTASFERLVGDKLVDFWVTLNAGTPLSLAAAAA
ncbi:MAG: hypothetical protein Q9220_006459 [cf. Caloplaca sp. 1 TL-2023]